MSHSHKCIVNKEDPIMKGIKWHQRIRLVSLSNPRRLSYFRSEVSVREEQHRHLEVNEWAIHPFSTFRAWYELYLVFLFGSVLFTKSFDAGFMTKKFVRKNRGYYFYTTCMDFFCWIDICLNFLTGYEIPRNRIVELRPLYIAKHYIFGSYFIFDVISSFPRSVTYSLTVIPDKYHKYMRAVVTIMGLFKIIRIGTFVKCLYRSAEYFHIKSKGKFFLFVSTIICIIVIHWMGCLQYYIPRVVRRSFKHNMENTSWYIVQKLDQRTVVAQYTHSVFKSSAYILGIQLFIYQVKLPEEYLLAIFTYVLGKILIAFIWIILAVAILNSRLMEIKFQELLNELKEYMKQKQLPSNLCDRILQYFLFKYRNKYFKEELINSMLSENLRNEANLHVCRSLIKSVPLFSDLDPMQLRKVVDCLISEIFLPNDTIIRASTYGDAMYFLFSGTVAVFSRTGKEICHLQDGTYFGEISLLLKGQLRTTTIVALEESQIFRLNKKDFEKFLMTNKEVKAKMLSFAERRLKEATKIDEEYKEKLFEEEFRKVTPE